MMKRLPNILACMPAARRTTRRIGLGLVLGLALCASLPLMAQNRAQRSIAIHQMYSENHMLSLVPVPLFFNGFRIDYDYRLKDNLWLNVAPQFNYRRKADRPDGQYKKVNMNAPLDAEENALPVYTLNQTGFCLELNLRYYQPGTNRQADHTGGLYYAAGLGFEYNQSDRLNSEDTPYSVNTTRIGTQIQIGYLCRMWPRATFDIYIGAAWRNAINGFKNPEHEAIMMKDVQRSWTYQYNGIFAEAGIRIGFML